MHESFLLCERKIASAGFFQLERIMQRLHGQFHVFAIDQHGNLDFDVAMTLMLMPSSLSVLNIFAATPDWLRIPMPTADTLATSLSATKS